MFYKKTYLDKCATIIKDSEANTGLNPVSDLVWGRNCSRLLVYFDHTKLKEMVNDKTYPDISKLHHRLKMTNAGSLDKSELHKEYLSQIDNASKKRASSFDLIFFLIPKLWDAGKGFDYTKTYLNTNYYDKDSYEYKLYELKEGVNWYNCRNGYTWANKIDYKHTKNGLLDFYIKSDINIIPTKGATVTFTYHCECNDNNINVGLKLEDNSPSLDNPLGFGQSIYFAKNRQICHSQFNKEKYCAYIKQSVEIPETTSKKNKNLSFILEYTIDGKKYTSNPYYIKQLGTESEYYPDCSDGIYSTETLQKELAKYELGDDSIIIGKQHFDIGDENVDIDITSTVNKYINGDLPNYGIGIAFEPLLELSESNIENYVGILTNKTNSFFEPYIETYYDDIIDDNRANFILGKNNKLYLYSNIGGKLENLDDFPTCSVDDIDYEVKQATKGVYYIDINLPIVGNEAPVMHYDIWDNLMYMGQKLPSVELDFTTQSPYAHFGIGTSLPEKNTFTPTVYGINDNEIIKRGDLRKLGFIIRKNYTQNDAANIDGVEARLYILDGTAQVDVIPYMKVNRAFTENFIMIDTSMLIPQMYYLDVKINYGMESIEHHDILHFKIVDDTNNKYE